MKQDQFKAYIESPDAAWASINTPLTIQDLKLFCQDVERLFRINPMLIFKKWQAVGADRYHFSGQNISQEKPFYFDLILTVSAISDGIKISYQQGLKTSTFIIIEAIENNALWLSRLTIIDNYDADKAARLQALPTVDKSITVWAEHLQRYLYTWKQWSHIAPWRWYMQKIWQPMKPISRRITYILVWITFLEVILIMLGVIIYYLEYN